VPRTEKDLKSPLSISVGDGEARTDCQCGELIDRIAAAASVRKLLFVEVILTQKRRTQFSQEKVEVNVPTLS
jgi:hypothetical protein